MQKERIDIMIGREPRNYGKKYRFNIIKWLLKKFNNK